VIKVTAQRGLWADKDDAPQYVNEVFDPSPLSNSGDNNLFLAATARGKTLGTQISGYTLYSRFEDARRATGVGSAQDIVDGLTFTDRNRVIGLRTGPRAVSPTVVPRTFEEYSQEIVAPTWPRSSWAQMQAECGTVLENGLGGVGSEDRLNIRENFGVWVSIRMSPDYDPLNYGPLDRAIIWDRCGYFYLMFNPFNSLLGVYMETESDEVQFVAPVTHQLTAGTEYIIGVAYETRQEPTSGKMQGRIRIGWVTHPSGLTDYAEETFTWLHNDPGQKIRDTALGSFHLLQDWSGRWEADEEMLGITSFRVDKKDHEWDGAPDKSYWDEAVKFQNYLAGLQLTGATLNAEPGTVCLIKPKEYDPTNLYDESDLGGYDFKCRGSTWGVREFDGDAGLDFRCYAKDAYAGSYSFYIWVPKNSADEILGESTWAFRIYDDSGHSEDIGQERIDKIEKVRGALEYTLRGTGNNPDVVCAYYKVTLHNVPGNALANDYDMVGANLWTNWGDYGTHPNGYALFQRQGTTRKVFVKLGSNPIDVCYSRSILPPHRFKLLYFGRTEHPDVYGGVEVRAVLSAVSNDLENWTVNTRMQPIAVLPPSQVGDTEKLGVFMDGIDTIAMLQNNSTDSILAIYTQDITGWDENTQQLLGDVLFTRPDTFDEQVVGAPAVSADRTGNYALIYKAVDSLGNDGFGAVYSANFFKWARHRSNEPFLVPGNLPRDINGIDDPSKFFEFNGRIWMAWTGTDDTGERSICFGEVTGDDLTEADLPDDEEIVFEDLLDLSNRVKGLHEYRYQDYSTIIMACAKAIMRDEGDGDFRVLRTEWRVMKQFNTIELSDLDHFMTTAKSHVVMTCGDLPNQKFHNDDAWTTFLGVHEADPPNTLAVDVGGGAMLAGDYRYAISWESNSIEGNISEYAQINGVGAGDAVDMRLPLPYHSYGALDLEDHAVRTINIWRKYDSGAGFPQLWDWLGEYTINLADWQTANNYVDYKDTAAGPPASYRQPYTRHNLPPRAKFCIFHPTANRLVLLDETNLYYSETDFFEAFPPENEINLDDGSGDIIKGVALHRDDLFVFFEKKTIKVVFRGTDIFPLVIDRSIGVLATRTIAESPKGIFALTNDGVRVLTGNGWSDDISRAVKYYLDLAIEQGNKYWIPGSAFESINPNGLWLSNAAFFDDKYTLDVPWNTNYPRIRLTFFLKNGTWSVGRSFPSSIQIPILLGAKKHLWGSIHGPVIFQVGGDSDNGIRVEGIARTKEFNLNREDVFKQMYEVFPRIDSQTGIMDVTAIIDRGVEAYSTRFATPERFAIMAWIPPGVDLPGPVFGVVPDEIKVRNERRAVVPDYMIFKRVQFEFYDNGKGTRSEIKGIAFSFTYEDSELA